MTTQGLPRLSLSSRVAAAPAEDPQEPQGIWSVADDGLIIVDRDGPATVLVPGEAVLLMVVDLPIANRAKRLEALPFAVEDRIADPIDSVHIALGDEIAARRFLVGVVRHAVMERWVALAEAAGLGSAPLVPESLALPVPDEGDWSVALAGGRAVVRASDGTGFTVAEPILQAAWEAAGKPRLTSFAEPLPGEMGDAASVVTLDSAAQRLALAPLDLRQGRYAVKRAAAGGLGRRLLLLAGIAVVAHTLIGLADVAMLRTIADARAEDTRALVALAAPGTTITGDIKSVALDMLPPPGPVAQESRFLPLVNAVSVAMLPLKDVISVRSMRFDGTALLLEVSPPPAGTEARIAAAVRDAGLDATATPSTTGITLRVTER